jgi:hypothetical protein
LSYKQKFKIILWLLLLTAILWIGRNLSLVTQITYLAHFIVLGYFFVNYKPKWWEKTQISGLQLATLIVVYYLIGFFFHTTHVILNTSCLTDRSCQFFHLGFLITVLIWPATLIGLLIRQVPTPYNPTVPCYVPFDTRQAIYGRLYRAGIVDQSQHEI